VIDPIATQITSAVLGPRPLMTFCSGNSAMPPTPSSEPQRQPVHSDADFAHPNHPFALVVNIPLITMTPENGSTEIWLGTHLDSGLDVQEGDHGDRASGRIKEHVLEERRTVRRPSQPVIPKGSIVVRDLRLWHAGMPNWTEEVRVMLAMSGSLNSITPLLHYSIRKTRVMISIDTDCVISSLCSVVQESDEA
jgi:ectoine hydroxylase-related dioxygenase (phytanoyl-CoA dioxygenase family)